MEPVGKRRLVDSSRRLESRDNSIDRMHNRLSGVRILTDSKKIDAPEIFGPFCMMDVFCVDGF